MMNTSATSAVVLSRARVRISASGRKTTIWMRIVYWIGRIVAQFVIAAMKA
jgi:hypothetical protein